MQNTRNLIKKKDVRMRKVKILTISSSGFSQNEGIGTVIYDYFKRFDKSQFELHLVVAGKYKPDIAKKFEEIHVTPHYFPSRNAELPKYFSKLIKLCREQKYDIVYVHGSSALLSIDLLAVKLAGCRHRVVHSHGTKCDHVLADRLLRPLLYTLYTDAFACGMNAGKWLYGARDFQLIRNGRSIEQYRYDPDTRAAMRKELKIPEDCVAVGHVGNFNGQKNQEFLIYVFAELIKQEEKSKLFFMGDGFRRYPLQGLAEELGIKNNVVFLGNITNVPSVLQAMDIMALPSLHEGLPLAVVECQLAALPCLVSDTVTKECVFSNLVSFESLERGYGIWASKLLSMYQEAGSRGDEKIALQAREAGFDIDADAEELQALFRKMVG